MQVGILGPLEVRGSDGLRIDVTGARLRTLLAGLALGAGRPVTIAALVDAVWGDDPPADEQNALQTLVSRLRRALGDAGAVEQSAGGYRLALAESDVDARRMRSLAEDGARLLRAGDPARAAPVLRSALELWRGPALGDLADRFAVEADRLEQVRASVTVDRISAELALGQAESVVAELEMLAADHPLDERIAARLVTALGATGRQAEALAAFERARGQLADDLGVDPGPELRAAHLAVLRGEVAERPAPPTRRTNLKAQLTSFVGREDEVARVGAALTASRLVTIVGPGGAGKTRLAGEAGAALTPPDGVWLAELAPLTDPAAVPQTVLAALGLREKQVLDRAPSRSAPDALSRLVEVLADKSAVLVLDNCEHLIDASAQLAEQLLQAAPALRVLATSREPLGITGETVLAIPPLGQPRSSVTASQAMTYPAVRLFADRAAAAQPGFAVDDDNVATVVDIVRRLDGLPLAIELAAARLRTLTVDEIAARLQDRFRLLTGGSRTALPRHRTLRAVVEWSWELLTEPERRVAERVAVFPAGIVAESAVAVCADAPSSPGAVAADAVAGEDVAELLAALVDKSLLQRVGDTQRLRMLETIREFGVERLAERGELDPVRRRHAVYFADLLGRAEPHLIRREQLVWLDLLTTEHDNVTAAFRFSCSEGAADRALQIMIGLAAWALLLGKNADMAGWAADALAVPGATDEPLRVAGRALYAMFGSATLSDTTEASEASDLLKVVAGELDQLICPQHPMLSVLRVAVAFFNQDAELAERIVTEHLGSDDPWERATGRMMRINLRENEGDLDAMRSDVGIALREFRQIGERWGLASVLRSQALLETMDGDLDAAETSYREALDLITELQSQEDRSYLMIRLADLSLRRGDEDAAIAMMREALDSAEGNGLDAESVFTLSMMADFQRRAGEADLARELHERARRRMEEIPLTNPMMSHASAIVLTLAARFAFDDGDRPRAARLAAEGYVAAVRTKDLPILAAVGVTLADMAAELGNDEIAAEMLGATAQLRGGDDPLAPDIAELTASLRESLGAPGFQDCYARGKSLDRDAALKRIDPAEALGAALGEVATQTRRL